MPTRRSSRQPAAASSPSEEPSTRGHKRKNSETEEAVDAPPAPKRGRGRPRANSAASSVVSADLPAEGTPKKARGRPRANSNASASSDPSTPSVVGGAKRARARPRGYSNASLAATESPAAREIEDTAGGGGAAVQVEAKDGGPDRDFLSLLSAADPDPTVKPAAAVKDEDEIDESFFATAPPVQPLGSVRCPYLDTVCRPLLDFDMAKACSVTLSDQNVYACLVCGKFFQGRGKSTPLYTHSVQFGHFVVMSLHTGRAYCLPDGYEIGAGEATADARSLADVQRCLHPSFSVEEISRLSRHNTALARDVHGVSYLPGFVGLNNLSHTDYVSVTLHALSHVTPIRDFFLVPSNYNNSKSALVHSFGEVMRKMWSGHNFKSVVSPQEFLQQVSVSSKKRFVIGRQQECVEFMVWLLNELHRGIGGTNRPDSSVIYRALQGHVKVHSMKKKAKAAPQPEVDDEAVAMDIAAEADGQQTSQWEETEQASPFLYLSLDIPPTPLFKDSQGGLVIPQIPLFEVLKKFDGDTWTDVTTSTGLVRRRYVIKKLPKYLMVHLVRFTRNNFYVEKNPSIVTFPVKNLEMKHYAHNPEDRNSRPATCTREEVPEMGIGELRAAALRNIQATNAASGGTGAVGAACQDLSRRLQQCVDRSELNDVAVDSIDLLETTQSLSSKYDLLCNVCHDSLASQGTDIGSDHKSISGGPTSSENVLTQGSYRCHLQNKATGQWFELQDLHVTETLPQLIGLSESYLLIYERKDVAGDDIAS